MITITYGSREPPSLTIRGHSGYATQGTDIVCAAVSALFVTLSNSLTEYYRVHERPCIGQERAGRRAYYVARQDI